MKLSFVIPAYNEENYLGDCLASIKREAGGKNYDLEIIVVNNASTDKTKELALSYEGVRVIDEPQKGLVRARQAGALSATGDLIANIDADTRLTKGWLEKVFNNFNDPKLMGLSGPERFFDLPWYFNIASYLFYFLGWIAYHFTQLVWHEGAMMQGGNFIIRRTALEQAGGFNVGQFDFYGEDTDIACRVAKVGKTRFDFGLLMLASGRRFKKEGYVTLTWRYAINYFWTIFFKRPYSESSIDIRETK